jgi:hypothetical protein
MRQNTKLKTFVSLLIILMILHSGVAVVSSQSGEDDSVPVVLINGTKIFIKSDESHSFYQGYKLQIKGVNQEAERLWLDLSLNGRSVKSDVVHEGEHFTYKRDSKVVLNITVDKIYSNPENELVTFKSVYQYLDPQLETPKLNNSEKPANSSNDTNSTNNPNGEDGYLQTAITIVGTVSIGVIVVYILYKNTT